MRLFSGIAALLISLAAIANYFYPSAGNSESLTKSEYQFLKISCWFDADWTATITCGELQTPDGFHLSVVILHNDAEQRRADPIVYLQGGPGFSARLHTEGIKSWLNWMRYSNTRRDLILVDTRGTGRSRPALACNEYNQFNQRLLRQNLALSDELSKGYEVALRCFSAAAQQYPQLDYRNFSTQTSARDIRALMAELHYPEWNILGVSYGTRLALEIALQEQQSPRNVKLKSMLLDSIYPAGFGGVQTWPQVLDDGIQQFINGCNNHPECAKKINAVDASLEQLFMRALEHLRENPQRITVRRWDGEAPIIFMINDHRFLSATFAAVYDPNDWPEIFDAITGVLEGRTNPLKLIVEPYLNNSLTNDFNSLTFTAVDCADNPVGSGDDYAESLQEYPLLQNYTRDQWRYQLCHQLPSESPLALAAPQVPTLILSGALDPITPIAWAKTVSAQWSQSQLVVRENQAHSVLSSDICLLENLDTFFDQPANTFTACRDPSEIKTN